MTRRPTLSARLGAGLRRPWTIVAELSGVALAGAALSAVPQAGEQGWLRLEQDHPGLAAVARAFSLDQVLTAWWFLAILAVACASLSLVVFDQWRRARRQWREPLAPASFQAARYLRVFEREAAKPGRAPRAEFRTRGRAGVLGSPLFHTGLLVAVVAGVLRALLAAEAVAPLVEGQELPAGPAGYAAQRRGWLARPFGLEVPVRLDRVEAKRYASGDLEHLAVEVSVGGERRHLAINQALDLPGGRLYLSHGYGPAAVLDLEKPGREPERLGALLHEAADGVFEGRVVGVGGTDVRLSSPPRREPGRPTSVRLRVLRRGALLFMGDLVAGQGVEWPDGERLSVLAIASWAEVRGARDPSVWLLVVGAAVAILGAALTFTVIRVDTAVMTEPTPAGERVRVALRAQRLAPLFADRFEELVRREGGPPG